MFLQEAGGRIACPKKSKKGPVTIDMLIDFCTKFKDCKHLFVIRDVTMISLKVQKLLQNSMLWRSTCFYIVTVVHWNIVFIESCMYKFVLGKINKLQKKMISLCLAGFLRYDEISSLLCNNVKLYDECIILFIEKQTPTSIETVMSSLYLKETQSHALFQCLIDIWQSQKLDQIQTWFCFVQCLGPVRRNGCCKHQH